MESYVREVYSRLSKDDPNLEFVGYASRELATLGAPWFPGTLVNSGVSGESRVDWARGELFAVGRYSRRTGADVIHAPANFGPVLRRVPVVLTVHDLLPFAHPEYVPGAYAGVLRALIRRAARAAKRVLTVSDASKADVMSLLGIEAGRIVVTPLAGSTETPRPTPAAVERRSDLVLAIGNRMPHKNFPRLLDALALVPPARRPRLVITGSHGEDPLAKQVANLGLGDSVELRGWIDRAELERLYSEATVLVFPTLFEGFGLPTLEAMSRGCPVICSDLPVMHEVAGDAAHYFDPLDSADIARTLAQLLDAPAELARMAAAGRARASRFSWERAAGDTRKALLDALDD